MAILSCAIAFFVLQGGNPGQHVVQEYYSKTLPVSAKPKLTPAPLKGKKVISAGEYAMEGQPVMRLFRYSFKGTVEGFSSSVAKQLKGWVKDVLRDNVGKPEPSQGFSFTGPSMSGAISRQTLAVTPGRLVLDSKARFGSRRVAAAGWISVSYNESLAKAK